MNDEIEGATYIAALDKTSATEWTLVTLGLLSIAIYILMVASWAIRSC